MRKEPDLGPRAHLQLLTRYGRMPLTSSRKKGRASTVTDEIDELIGIRDAAKMLGVHPSTLRNWDRTGRLRAVRVGSRRDRRFKKSEVLAEAGAQRPRDCLTVKDLKQAARLARQGSSIADIAKAVGTTPSGLNEVLARYGAAMEALNPMRDVERALAKALPRWRGELNPAVLQAFPTIEESLAHLTAPALQAFPTFHELVEPLLWEQKLLGERLRESISSIFEAETFSSGVYARLAATQAELFSAQAITTLAGSFEAGGILGASSPIWDQISANIAAYQDLTRAALWDVEAVTAAVDKRLPFAELKLAGGLLASATSLAADFRTKTGEAGTTAVKKPNVFRYFHDEARQVTEPTSLSVPELEAELRRVKSFQAGNTGLEIVEAWRRINRIAQFSGRPAIFQPSVDVVTVAAWLPFSFAGNEAEFGEVVDGLYKFIFEASGDGSRLRALAEPDEYAAVEDIVVLRHYYRHDLAQGASIHDSRRRFGRVGDVFERLVGKRLPCSPADWHRACLALMQQAEGSLRAIADRFEGQE